jgi:hypothetical protein
VDDGLSMRELSLLVDMVLIDGTPVPKGWCLKCNGPRPGVGLGATLGIR